MKQPNLNRSIENYRELASDYDRNCVRVMPIREKTVALLKLRSGDVVLDVASGTGLSFPLLMQAIGTSGHLIAIESSPDMMAVARRRVAEGGWKNVTLIEASADSVEIAIPYDAVLFHFTHDVMQSDVALERIFRNAKASARIAVAGAKLRSWWLAPVNLWMLWRGRHYLTAFTGLQKPWKRLSCYVPDLSIESRLLGTAYVGSGRYDAATSTRPTTDQSVSCEIPYCVASEHSPSEARL